VINDPEDYCNNIYTNIPFKCIFWDKGVAKRRVRYDQLFSYLKSSNTPLDYFIQDLEASLSNWEICVGNNPATNQPMFDSIAADIRFDPIRNALTAAGMPPTDPLGSVCDFFNSPNYLYWNKVMITHVNNYLRALTNDVAQQYYPNLLITNYGRHAWYAPYQLEDVNGHNTYINAPGVIGGNRQSIVLYGQALSVALGVPNTLFNRFRYDINQVLNARKGQPFVPVHAWVPDLNLDISAYLHNSTLWEELIFHTVTNGITVLEYFNPIASANSTTLNTLLTEFNLLAGYAERTSKQPTTLDWTSDYILSCTQVRYRRVCRFTPQSTATYVVTSAGLEIQTPTKHLVFSRGMRYKPNGGSMGAWVVQPSNASEVVIYNVMP